MKSLSGGEAQNCLGPKLKTIVKQRLPTTRRREENYCSRSTTNKKQKLAA